MMVTTGGGCEQRQGWASCREQGAAVLCLQLTAPPANRQKWEKERMLTEDISSHNARAVKHIPVPSV